MGSGASSKNKKKIIPQFTVTIVVNGEPMVAIDVCEDATLADARKEILLESEDFPNLPKEYHFSSNGAPFSIRKEHSHGVRELAGSDSRLLLIPKETNNNNDGSKDDKTKRGIISSDQQEDEEDKIEATLDKVETAIDTVDEMNNTIVDYTTEETQMVQQDGTVTKENEISVPSFIKLDDTSLAILNDVLDGIEVVAEIIPYVQLFIKTCKNIYNRCQEPSRLRAEIQDFLHFLKIIETSIVKGLKQFPTEERLKLINNKLIEASKTIKESQNRSTFSAFFYGKADREKFTEIKKDIMDTMTLVNFTMQIDANVNVAKLMAKEEELHSKFENVNTSEDALETLLQGNDDVLKNEILQHLNLNEQDLILELNELKKRLTKVEETQEKMAETQDKILKQIDITTSLKIILDPLDFNLEIDGAVERFHNGTREWAFQDFDNWVEKILMSRIFVLSGGAGMGKTGIMSMLVRTRNDKSVIAHHFCRHDDSRKRDPKHVLCSIAYQLAEKIPEYQQKLEELGLTSATLSKLNVTGLFDKILRAPLADVKRPDEFKSRQIILIDALDECDHNGKNDLLDCIRDHFLELPEWLGFFLTTRPEINIMKQLSKFHPEELIANSEKNMKDIQLYIGDALKQCIVTAEIEEGVEILSKKSNGVFIYARYAVEKLNMQSDHISLEELKEFPDGITGFYDIQFRRLFGSNYENVLNNSVMWRIVEVVMAVEEPIHVEALDYLIQCKPNERKVAVAKLSLLFPIRDRKLHVFHKSVKDWLVDLDRKEEICYVDVDDEIHEKIGLQCHELLNESLTYNDKKKIKMEKALVYSLKHCVTHMCHNTICNCI